MADATAIQIVAPTGFFGRPTNLNPCLKPAEEDLPELWTAELLEGIEGEFHSSRFLKAADERRWTHCTGDSNLEAAARASQNTGAVIASHTIGGQVARKEMDILEAAGLDLQRFIWVHAQTEPDLSIVREAAGRGALIELDTVGAPFQPQTELLETVLALIEAGFIDHLLLSHDAGWYNPARPDGLPDEGYRGYTALVRDFLPELLRRGITQEQVRVMTVDNPARAFAF